MSKNPAFMMYPGDWMKDAALRMCSIATRGIWIDLLCAMYEQATDGSLTGTVEQLARIPGVSAAEMHVAIEELRTTNTADVTLVPGSGNADVTLVSRSNNAQITLVSRRIKRFYNDRVTQKERQERSRQLNKNRQDRFRQKHAEADVTHPVTPVSRECHAPSSYSYSSSVKDARKEGALRAPKKSAAAASAARPHTRSLPSLNAIVAEFQALPNYRRMNVAEEAQKCAAYFSDRKIALTRQHLVNWLDRANLPPAVAVNGYHARGPDKKAEQDRIFAELVAWKLKEQQRQ